MKNLYLLLIAIILVSCQGESLDSTQNVETTADRIASILTQEANEIFDTSKEGLFKGIFSSYDLTIKGTIILNLGNDNQYDAAVSLIKGDARLKELYFKGRRDAVEKNKYHFKSALGSFVATVSSDNKITVAHFTYNERDCYIAAFKKTKMIDVTLALGTYVDDADAAFTGNWDAVHQGSVYTSPAGEHSTFPSDLQLLDAVVITHGGNMLQSTDTPANNDSFTETCFYNVTFPHAYFFATVDNAYREFLGYNQTTTFNGTVASWNLSYYFFNGVFLYDTPNCSTSQAAGYGNWTWNGRAGKLYVDSL